MARMALRCDLLGEEIREISLW